MGQVLRIGLIALPLVIFLVVFADDITQIFADRGGEANEAATGLTGTVEGGSGIRD